jgi:hypothetical protein
MRKVIAKIANLRSKKRLSYKSSEFGEKCINSKTNHYQLGNGFL